MGIGYSDPDKEAREYYERMCKNASWDDVHKLEGRIQRLEEKLDRLLKKMAEDTSVVKYPTSNGNYT